MDWVNREVKEIQVRLDELENMEGEAWSLTAFVHGSVARTSRADKWMGWYGQQLAKLGSIKTAVWSTPGRSTHAADGTPAPCQRSAGHVEKVKLPSFSGKHEDFCEFQSQFRELCRGERYTPVLEMAQLRTKLPREALP